RVHGLDIDVAVDKIGGAARVDYPLPVDGRMAAGFEDLHLRHTDGPQVLRSPLGCPPNIVLVPGQRTDARDAQEVQELAYVCFPVLLEIGIVLRHGASSPRAMAEIFIAGYHC